MILNKKILVAVLGLLLSACASHKPIGWAYAVGDPILYERPLYPYHSIGYVPNYQSSVSVLDVVSHDEHSLVGAVGNLSCVLSVCSQGNILGN